MDDNYYGNRRDQRKDAHFQFECSSKKRIDTTKIELACKSGDVTNKFDTSRKLYVRRMVIITSNLVIQEELELLNMSYHQFQGRKEE